ncbi:hypothetical protein EYF80_062363 [Liparis tanakae]|uniref:Uncharacterized protein n=1 Tax=Liparis tanakae TaxID=230148 RepID=A0A4Z2EFG2_9TELE|nr:hypothetical protein EYF80_062363 [Liparis tanakae]
MSAGDSVPTCLHSGPNDSDTSLVEAKLRSSIRTTLTGENTQSPSLEPSELSTSEVQEPSELSTSEVQEPSDLRGPGAVGAADPRGPGPLFPGTHQRKADPGSPSPCPG